jgi:hypothetical protein
MWVRHQWRRGECRNLARVCHPLHPFGPQGTEHCCRIGVAVFGQDLELGNACRVEGDGAKIGPVDYVQTQTTIRPRQYTVNDDVTRFPGQPHQLALLDGYW